MRTLHVRAHVFCEATVHHPGAFQQEEENKNNTRQRPVLPENDSDEDEDENDDDDATTDHERTPVSSVLHRIAQLPSRIRMGLSLARPERLISNSKPKDPVYAKPRFPDGKLVGLMRAFVDQMAALHGEDLREGCKDTVAGTLQNCLTSIHDLVVNCTKSDANKVESACLYRAAMTLITHEDYMTPRVDRHRSAAGIWAHAENIHHEAARKFASASGSKELPTGIADDRGNILRQLAKHINGHAELHVRNALAIFAPYLLHLTQQPAIKAVFAQFDEQVACEVVTRVLYAVHSLVSTESDPRDPSSLCAGYLVELARHNFSARLSPPLYAYVKNQLMDEGVLKQLMEMEAGDAAAEPCFRVDPATHAVTLAFSTQTTMAEFLVHDLPTKELADRIHQDNCKRKEAAARERRERAQTFVTAIQTRSGAMQAVPTPPPHAVSLERTHFIDPGDPLLLLAAPDEPEPEPQPNEPVTTKQARDIAAAVDAVQVIAPIAPDMIYFLSTGEPVEPIVVSELKRKARTGPKFTAKPKAGTRISPLKDLTDKYSTVLATLDRYSKVVSCMPFTDPQDRRDYAIVVTALARHLTVATSVFAIAVNATYDITLATVASRDAPSFVHTYEFQLHRNVLVDMCVNSFDDMIRSGKNAKDIAIAMGDDEPEKHANQLDMTKLPRPYWDTMILHTSNIPCWRPKAWNLVTDPLLKTADYNVAYDYPRRPVVSLATPRMKQPHSILDAEAPAQQQPPPSQKPRGRPKKIQTLPPPTESSQSTSGRLSRPPARLEF